MFRSGSFKVLIQILAGTVVEIAVIEKEITILH